MIRICVIHAMHITTFDLNLLVAFDALIQDRNVTRAAVRVGLTQPAMSHALKRLRRICGDELFIRTRRGMEPTPYAQQLAVHVRDGLTALQLGLEQNAFFDPARSDRTFQLLMSDIGEVAYLPRLMTRVQQDAPNVSVRVLQLPRERYGEALESGDADLAIGHLPGLQAGFHQHRLFEDSFVCLVRAGHPRVKRKLSRAQFTKEAHVMIEPAGSRYSSAVSQSSTTTLLEKLLADTGLERRVALRVPQFMVVPAIVRATDLIATVPSHVAASAALAGVRVLPLPFAAPRFEVKQIWHARNHRDTANTWLRRLIVELFSKPGIARRGAPAPAGSE
jgi:DNA-binding transcriptional LysR family regulator